MDYHSRDLSPIEINLDSFSPRGPRFNQAGPDRNVETLWTSEDHGDKKEKGQVCSVDFPFPSLSPVLWVGLWVIK